MSDTKSIEAYEFIASVTAYDSESGELVWKERDDVKNPKSWNSKYAGKPCGYLSKDGYRKIKIEFEGKRLCFSAHMVAWFHAYKRPPTGLIDHINQKPWDNRLVNLREVDHSTNARNALVPKSNKSGIVGVFWNSKAGKWQAAAKLHYKTHYLGLYENIEDAEKAAVNFRIQHGFAKTHGRSRREAWQ
jgi:hypothetical protein